MSELPDLRTLVQNLKTIAFKVRTDNESCRKMRKQLKSCGYSWPGVRHVNQNMVMKLFAVAVNEAIQTTVNLSLVDTVEEERKIMYWLFEEKCKKLSIYFSPPPPPQPPQPELPLPLAELQVLSWIKNAQSPLDIAVGLKDSAPQWLVKNIIQHQFDISWNTSSGKPEPDDYTFYQFCEKQKSRKFLKYKPRLAHVKATLYKERVTSQEFFGDFSEDKLCPNVYIKTLKGWHICQLNKDGLTPLTGKIYDPSTWMNESIWNFIDENSDIEQVLEEALDKPTLYWAVLDDKDFRSDEENLLNLKSIGRTQVYVGKANKGIRGRWTNEGKNHCKMMKKCLDNVYAMTTYDPSKLEGIQLVDARLALAKVRRERSALFVIKTFGDDLEKAEMAVKKAEKAYFEATDSEEEERLDDEWEKATITLANLKKEAKTKLEEAEKKHREGKRDNSSTNIIQQDVYDCTWEPKNMAYGMNCF